MSRGSRRFFLADGKWYEIGRHVHRIDPAAGRAADIRAPTLDLPTWDTILVMAALAICAVTAAHLKDKTHLVLQPQAEM